MLFSTSLESLCKHGPVIAGLFDQPEGTILPQLQSEAASTRLDYSALYASDAIGC